MHYSSDSPPEKVEQLKKPMVYGFERDGLGGSRELSPGAILVVASNREEAERLFFSDGNRYVRNAARIYFSYAGCFPLGGKLQNKPPYFIGHVATADVISHVASQLPLFPNEPKEVAENSVSRRRDADAADAVDAAFNNATR